jgi:hypothetical protein
MNNTIDFKTAKTIDSMSKKLDHIDDTVTGFFSVMHMAMKHELGSAEPYFAATSPVLDLTVIRPDDAPHILACFDEADEGIGISENEPLGFRYNPKQVVKQNENTLSVLKIAPGQYPQQVEIDNDLKALQQAVSGFIGASYLMQVLNDPESITG